jgi:transposase-like protein
VIKLGLPAIVRKFFCTTNMIEYMTGSIRKVTRNVKRWRSDQMAHRWTIAGIERGSQPLPKH